LHYFIDKDLNANGYFFYNTFSIKQVNDHSEAASFSTKNVVRQSKAGSPLFIQFGNSDFQ